MNQSDETPKSQAPLQRRLFQQVDSAILVLVRVVVGIGIYFWACTYTKIIPYDNGFVPLYEPVFIDPKFLFKYAGFEWVRLWPGNGIAWHFMVTKVAAICLAVGFLTRVSAAVLCGSIAYVLLVERQIYLNHYYLLSCAAGLLVFLPAGRRWSVDAWIGIERPATTFYRWQFWLLQFQLGMPYVFGAIAKMNSDWLGGQPAGIMLHDRTHLAFVNAFVKLPWSTEIFAYGGLLFDLLVVPMLMYRRTRWLAVAMAFVFHVSNSQLFMIGVFPWFMLATLIVFFPVDTFPNLIRYVRTKFTDDPITYQQAKLVAEQQANERRAEEQAKSSLWPTSRISKAGFALAVCYVVIQLLLPVRPWVLPGNPSWNERGQRFAWRMMLRHKVTMTHYLITSPTGDFQFFSSQSVMTPYQSSRAERNPELLRQAAVQLQSRAEAQGIPDTKVYCLALVSLNGRRPVPLIDPTVDLTKVKRGWFYDDWVTQKVGALPKTVWSYPKEEWWKRLVIPEPFKPLQGRTPSELDDYIKAEFERVKKEAGDTLD